MSANGEVKDEEKKEQVHINLKVKSQDGGEIYFKIRRQSPLGKLMDAYCQRQGVQPGSMRFIYDGNRLQANQTPQELEMDDGDEIDAMVEQVGGNC
mmetsp:Transcript_15117/g.25881  ORF Transcript_15117/g.25881 Transcript_15117/m.25881 type:complete len:96 (+) Transcript_15117:139-426(+)|eukprot:CAMPEP_0196659210 /NCGR_PEP_ID=MMETSP1086-20130531/33716_1 /TAXON_ID=77921 /ORGANISM="Cyanoptyche  gloeocystis , Strain SAG4.97" /LENGTH=95 /DNA_ID=CAMNT_0041993089 /DNA_START=139 /DNA_END=426 /DNA_ORIENTATION=-